MPEKPYDHNEIELKWFERWENATFYRAEENSAAPKFNVLDPMGWDSFGLPAENAEILNKRHPRDWTRQNIANMKKTHRRFAFSYDWEREISTCEPEYYRWNQWFFLKMLE